MEDKKPLTYLERLKQKAQSQTTYGCADFKPVEASMDAVDCPNCGAGRAKQDGLTHCGYCGFEFISVKLNDGIHIKKEDNSQK